MQVNREKAVSLLKALDYKTANKWDDKRLTKKLAALPTDVSDDVVTGDPDLDELLDDIIEAVETGGTIEFETDDIEAAESEEVEEEQEEAEDEDDESEDTEEVSEAEDVDESDGNEELIEEVKEETKVASKKRAGKKAPAKKKTPKKTIARGAKKKAETEAPKKRGRPKKAAVAAETEAPKKRGRPTKKKAAASGNSKPKRKKGEVDLYASRRGPRPGIIDLMIGWLEKATEKRPLSRDQLLARLVKKFPERNESAMRVTVYSQVPVRLRKVKDLDVQEDDNKRYWIES